MAGKKDMEALVSQIQSLCLDYRAYRQIAKSSREPERWAVFLNEYKRDNRSHVVRQFDAVNADLQSGVPESDLCRALIHAIDKATL